MYQGISRVGSYVFHLLLLTTILFIVFIHLYLQMPGVDAGIHMYGAFLISKGLFPYTHLWNNKPPLIYLIGTVGFLIRSNPFLGVRIFELIIFFLNLFLLNKILSLASLKDRFIWLLSFSAIYLVCWDEGFLTETFTIPLALSALYFFLIRIRYYEFICALLLVSAFLLKQNGFLTIAGIAAADIFWDYRQRNTLRKVIRYLLALLICLLILILVLEGSGIWHDFLDQVFVYNTEFAESPTLYRALIDHIRHNSFLSVKGISAVIIFNICILLTLRKLWIRRRNGRLNLLWDKMLLVSTLIYLLSYFFVYITGKTYPHYFILLIVPATLIMGHYVAETMLGKIALLILLIVGFSVNISRIDSYKTISENRRTVADFLKQNSPPNEFIHLVGFGNQYIYVMADRLSNTKFVMPLFENNGYTKSYQNILRIDFSNHPPLFIILNKNNYKKLDPGNFYTQIVMQTIARDHQVFENELFVVYKRND
jgi:hypothetical protein